MLEYTQKGAVKNNRHNCKIILEHDPLLKGAFQYNILTGQVDIVKELWWKKESPAINDMDMNYIMLYLEENYGITIDKVVQKSIDHEADRHKYHPIRDYLNRLEWDGQERIRYVLHRFLGAPVNNLTYESMKMFLLGAISRVFTPGIKFEYMLCIVGGQGIGKSTFFRLLTINDDWFTDDIKKLEDENIYRRLRGHWIVELSEMVATSRAKSIEETKSFLSRQKETYKDLYALHAVDRPRQCVFGGTSNKKKFQPFDRIGNRRFIPIQANHSEMEVHILDNEKESRAYLEQVWAEALDNPYVKPKKSDTDRICEIMNTSIVGWIPGPTTRFADYGTQRSWICVNQSCKQDNKNLKDENEWHTISEDEAKQMELPFD